MKYRKCNKGACSCEARYMSNALPRQPHIKKKKQLSLANHGSSFLQNNKNNYSEDKTTTLMTKLSKYLGRSTQTENITHLKSKAQ